MPFLLSVCFRPFLSTSSHELLAAGATFFAIVFICPPSLFSADIRSTACLLLSRGSTPQLACCLRTRTYADVTDRVHARNCKMCGTYGTIGKVVWRAPRKMAHFLMPI